MPTINTLRDLRRYLDARSISITDLSRAMYDRTQCGASVSIHGVLRSGKEVAFHPGQTDDYPEGFEEEWFTVQTIVEGSDAEVNSQPMYFRRVTEDELEEWIKYMEERAHELWSEVNEDDESQG
jgi:hypothetical protein